MTAAVGLARGFRCAGPAEFEGHAALTRVRPLLQWKRSRKWQGRPPSALAAAKLEVGLVTGN